MTETEAEGGNGDRATETERKKDRQKADRWTKRPLARAKTKPGREEAVGQLRRQRYDAG